MSAPSRVRSLIHVGNGKEIHEEEQTSFYVNKLMIKEIELKHKDFIQT